MRKRVLGATLLAAGFVLQALPASADDRLDEVLKRLDKIEKRDAALANENAALRRQLNKRDDASIKNATPAKPGVSPAVGAVLATRTPTPAPALVAPEIDANGHGFLEHKKGNPLTFYTPGGEITGYGNIDISFDDTTKALAGNINNTGLAGGSEPAPVGNFGWMPAIASNSSYLGVRGFQRLPNLPFNFVYQLEVGFDVSSTPGTRESNSNLSNGVNGSLFNRNTYIGFANPEWGAVKIGKTTSPYERSTGGFNPFAGEIGDMHVIMGNTGGDNRVEFGGRLDHSIWYESPTIGGFQFNALFSPGQNRATINDNIPAGSGDCTGGNDPTSGGNLPVTCGDGSFGNAVSANLSYTNGPLYVTAAYERHFGTNRQSDIAAIYGIANSGLFTNASSCSQTQAFGLANGLFAGPSPAVSAANFLRLCNEDVGDEDAWKVGALYTFSTKTTVGGIFESFHRYLPAELAFQNERQRNGTWFFVTQELTPVDSISFGWAHAFNTPGDPGQHNSATQTTLDGGATFANNDNSADMVTANYKHKFGSNLTWYTAVAATINGPTSHYDLGAGGHGVTTDAHSAFDATGGLASNPHIWTGPILAGVSTGIQWRF
ncbi:MAG TPA: porin [Bradyrhizobium sp.]|uniref:porin n=1 Tax=Bradyrhizobium sp. TaxID=376 RepID=UPI002D7F1DBE|nr:porin [Bradyrhizobium sp.]HET7885086.1 porin [Bradyrhizobium sp.]